MKYVRTSACKTVKIEYSLPNNIMADICTDVLLLALAEIPPRVSSAVCKRWRQIFLFDRMAAFRARLPDLSIKEIIDLPALFYNDLTLMQQILLPNELFEGADVITQARGYSRYRFQIQWDILRELDYINTLLESSKCGVVKFAPTRTIYFQRLFKHLIQYRHYIITMEGIDMDALIKYQAKIDRAFTKRTKINIRNACLVECRKAAHMTMCVWSCARNVKNWDILINSDFSRSKKKYFETTARRLSH